MGIFDFVNKPFFNPRYLFLTHMVQGALIITAIGLSIPALFNQQQPRTRSNTIALGMGAKSLVFLTYMLLSGHVASFKRWHSYKANVILSCLEIVFWAAVAFLVISANLDSCTGVKCGLSWGVVVVAIILHISMIYTSAVCFREFREYRESTKMHGSSSSVERFNARNGGDEEMMKGYPAQPKQVRTNVPGRQQQSQPHQAGWGGEQDGRSNQQHSYAQQGGWQESRSGNARGQHHGAPQRY